MIQVKTATGQINTANTPCATLHKSLHDVNQTSDPFMSLKRILILDGHPDTRARHLVHTLAQAYADGARSEGHWVRQVSIGSLEFPILRSEHEWKTSPLPPALANAQQDILWCEHLVLCFPLWMGDMPALVKGFIEQVARPDFAFDPQASSPFGGRRLAGRSARVLVTMGMPALVYRWLFRAHSVRSLERNVLGFMGFAPVRETLVGGVDGLGPAGVQRWSKKLYAMGVMAE